MALAKYARFASAFASAYTNAVPRALYRSTLSCVISPKESLAFCYDVLRGRDLGSDDPVLGSVVVDELIPGGGDVRIEGPFYTSSHGGTLLLLELATLAYVARALAAKRIFEIGTYLGRTTRLFAMNAPGAEVFTLDLPQGDVPHDKKLGRDFLDTPEAGRITQLTGDSRKFDYTPYRQTADFVWVDACHDYEFVANDTRAAMKVVKPGGWIGWHDYHHTSRRAGVTRYVREIRHQYNLIKHIRGTTIVLARVDA